MAARAYGILRPETRREFRLRIKRWKVEQKYTADTLSFDNSDKRWLAYLTADVDDLELLSAVVTHREWNAKASASAAFHSTPRRNRIQLSLLQKLPSLTVSSIEGILPHCGVILETVIRHIEH